MNLKYHNCMGIPVKIRDMNAIHPLSVYTSILLLYYCTRISVYRIRVNQRRVTIL